MLSRLAGDPFEESRKPLPACNRRKTIAATSAWSKLRFHDTVLTGGNEEEQAMSAILEYFTLFDLFIGAALIGIFCCGLLDRETN
jgi:hypothetical protein